MVLASIIIPAFNRSELLELTLKSLENQLEARFEVIIADHGSTDDTKSVANKFQGRLNLRYLYVPRRHLTPGEPRNCAAKLSESNLLIFVDSGIVVPCHYVQSHVRFHQESESSIGIGYYHGHECDRTEWFSGDFLKQLEKIEEVITMDPEIRDPRFNDALSGGVPLSQLCLPWVYCWSGNMSVSRDAFQKVGGFDLSLKFMFEDNDLAYRLHSMKINLKYVYDGWAFELPHDRDSPPKRFTDAYAACTLSYSKHKSLELEAYLLANLNAIRAEKIYRHLSTLSEAYKPTNFDLVEPYINRGNPTLFIGGGESELKYVDQVTTSEPNYKSNNKLWSCSGIKLPNIEGNFGTVIVGNLWTRLGLPINSERTSLIDLLIKELKLKAETVIFLDYGLNHEKVANKYTIDKKILQHFCNKNGLSVYHVRV